MSHTVIIGGGFAGLNAAIRLGRAGQEVTLIDRTNHHLFQPLLYQVATGFLAPGDIAAPIRSVVAKYPTVKVVLGELIDLNPPAREVTTAQGKYRYDDLIVATGVTHSYFGHDEWGKEAPGLKSVGDAVEIRRRVLLALEIAEQSEIPAEKKAFLTFAIVGGGPTGVELAGALAELARHTIRQEFRNFDPREVTIVLIEGGSRILSSFHQCSSEYAMKTLSKLGVQILTETRVVGIEGGGLELEKAEVSQRLDARTVVWAAGVKASSVGEIVATRTGASRDRAGRVEVSETLNVGGDAHIFVIGDLANCRDSRGKQLPGVAPVAIQQGKYVAKEILRRARGAGSVKPFHYVDKGSMAVIGRGRAVAETWKLRLHGLPAWMAWAFIHIYFLVEFENKMVVMFHWAWNYLTNKRGSRLIVE